MVLSSDAVSFEASAFVGSDRVFNVPRPISLAVLGTGLLSLGFTRRPF